MGFALINPPASLGYLHYGNLHLFDRLSSWKARRLARLKMGRIEAAKKKRRTGACRMGCLAGGLIMVMVNGAVVIIHNYGNHRVFIPITTTIFAITIVNYRLPCKYTWLVHGWSWANNKHQLLHHPLKKRKWRLRQ